MIEVLVRDILTKAIIELETTEDTNIVEKIILEERDNIQEIEFKIGEDKEKEMAAMLEHSNEQLDAMITKVAKRDIIIDSLLGLAKGDFYD